MHQLCRTKYNNKINNNNKNENKFNANNFKQEHSIRPIYSMRQEKAFKYICATILRQTIIYWMRLINSITIEKCTSHTCISATNQMTYLPIKCDIENNDVSDNNELFFMHKYMCTIGWDNFASTYSKLFTSIDIRYLESL